MMLDLKILISCIQNQLKKPFESNIKEDQIKKFVPPLTKQGYLLC